MHVFSLYVPTELEKVCVATMTARMTIGIMLYVDKNVQSLERYGVVASSAIQMIVVKDTAKFQQNLVKNLQGKTAVIVAQKGCGGSLCKKHGKLKNNCMECHPDQSIKIRLRRRIRDVINIKKGAGKRTIEYLGMSINELIEYISVRFLPGMTWDNYGEWEFGHSVPICFENPSFDQQKERLHYSNMFPQWKEDNAHQYNKYIWSERFGEYDRILIEARRNGTPVSEIKFPDGMEFPPSWTKRYKT